MKRRDPTLCLLAFATAITPTLRSIRGTVREERTDGSMSGFILRDEAVPRSPAADHVLLRSDARRDLCFRDYVGKTVTVEYRLGVRDDVKYIYVESIKDILS